MSDQSFHSHSHNLSINSIGSIVEPTTPPSTVKTPNGGGGVGGSFQHKRSFLNLWDNQSSVTNTTYKHINDLQLPNFNLDQSLPLNVNHLIINRAIPHTHFNSTTTTSIPTPPPPASSTNIVATPTKTTSIDQENPKVLTLNPITHPCSIDKDYLCSINKIPLANLKSEILKLSKDQYGCRFLQKKIDENLVLNYNQRLENFEIIFNEIYQYFYELIIDPFGNYLIQKLIGYCNEAKLNLILEILQFNLFQISINQHGTRALQKIIDSLVNQYQLDLLVQGLQPYIIELIKDLNGNHVIQKILNKFKPIQCQFIYNSILDDLVTVATHKHGCCVLQKCLNHVIPLQLVEFLKKILQFGTFFKLINDQFGNYVLQYLISINSININYKIYDNFLKFGINNLCNLKFSSNVIEKFLKNCFTNENKNKKKIKNEDEELVKFLDELKLDNNQKSNHYNELGARARDNLSNDNHNSITNSSTVLTFTDLKYDLIYQILLSDLNKLINDPYGNYVIQTLLDVLNNNQKSNKIYLLLPEGLNDSESIQVQIIKKWFLNCKILSSFGKRIQLKINSILNGSLPQQQLLQQQHQHSNYYKKSLPLNMNSNGEFIQENFYARSASISSSGPSSNAHLRAQSLSFLPSQSNYVLGGQSQQIQPQQYPYTHYSQHSSSGGNMPVNPGQSAQFTLPYLQNFSTAQSTIQPHPQHTHTRLNSHSNDFMIQNNIPLQYSSTYAIPPHSQSYYQG